MKQMKKLIILGFVCFLAFNSFAQDKDREARIKALKIAFITERLQLTEIEAQKFWPIYNTFEDKNNELRKQSFGKRKAENLDAMTEAEAKTTVNDMISIENQRSKLKEQFMKDLLNVMPAKKVLLLRATEDAFNKRMFDEWKKRREEREKKP